MRTSGFILAALLLLPLAACSTQATTEAPVISFLGISTGTLATQFDAMQFRQQFAVTEHELIAVVGFETIEDGTTVQATWFSPDDRRMPLGRTSIVTESGATVARFQFKNAQDWEASPYMLDIRAFKQPTDDTPPATASGQLHFFIGMDEEQIQAYAEELREYRNREAERNALQAEETAAREAVATAGRTLLNAPDAVVALEHDFDADGQPELVVADTTGEEPLMPGGGAGLLLSHPVRQFAIVGSGTVLLSMRTEGNEKVLDGSDLRIPARAQTTLLILQTGTLSILWEEDGQSCGADFTWDETAQQYRLISKRC